MWVCVCTHAHTLLSSWLCPGHLCLHATVVGAFHATLQVSWASAPSVALSSGERLCAAASPELRALVGQGFGSSFLLFWNSAQQLLNKYVEKVSLKEGFLPPAVASSQPPVRPEEDAEGMQPSRVLESERYKWACRALWGSGDWMEVSWSICPLHNRPLLISLQGVGTSPCSYWDLFDVVILHAIQSSVCHKNTANSYCSHFTFVETKNFYVDCIRGEASGCSGSMARPWRQCSAVTGEDGRMPCALCTCVFIKKIKTWESH